MGTNTKYINREVSWLKFNARVLQEARDKSVPLLERLRFLGIYSNNLDEFYKVRYATILRALALDSGVYNNIIENQSLEKLLTEIKEVVALQQNNYDKTYNEIIAQLENEKIYFIEENELQGEHAVYIKKLYEEKLSHTTAVFLLQPSPERIPSFREDAYYLAVKMTKFSDQLNIDVKTFAIIEVPTYIFSRFIVLPSTGKNKYFMMLEDAIRYNLDEIFDIFDYDLIEAHSIKSSKDAELDLDQDVQKSFMDRIERSVEGRRRGEPVRLVYDKDMAEDTLEYVKNIMHIDMYDSVSPGSRYHNKKDFIGFPDLGRAELNHKKIDPLTPFDLYDVKSYIKAIEKKDHLLHTPYTDYSIFLKFLRECAIDPKVQAIKMTVYRVADDSQIMSALVNAARNGKKVTAVLELRARFDETNNVNWSKILQDEGVQVIFGVADLKVHSKIGVVTYTDEKDETKLNKIAFVSTGNFHEKTALIYTDFTLLTSHKEIAQEVDEVFEFFVANYKVKEYEHLILSPFRTRNKLYELIDNEIQNQIQGLPAQINIKINSLSDKDMINKLYEANAAGVEVRLIVRGICCRIPGKPNLSENIKAISVVDKFLEHPRVFWFKNGGEDLVFISSADLMTRNIDHRIEVTCPIYDKDLKTEIMDTFDLSFTDNVKGRIQNATLDEIYQENDLPPNRSQISIYEYYEKKYNENN